MGNVIIKGVSYTEKDAKAKGLIVEKPKSKPKREKKEKKTVEQENSFKDD